MKGRMRKVRTYITKLEKQEEEAIAKCKELMKAGNKNRALVYLKKKKFTAKEVEKAQGAQIMLEETLQNVESAAQDVNIHEALKTGDKVLKDLTEKVSMDDWEELYADHKDNLARRDMEMEMFGEVLDDDVLEGELDALVDGAVAAEMGELAPQMDITAA